MTQNKSVLSWYLDRRLFLTVLEGRKKKHKYTFKTMQRMIDRGDYNRGFLEEKRKAGYNIGWLLGSDKLTSCGGLVAPPNTYLVIDVDCKKGKAGDGLEDLKKLEKETGITFAGNFPEVRTGSGTLHYYMRIEEPLKGKHFEGFSDQLEFQTNGLVVIPGSIHPDTGLEYDWDCGLEWHGEIPLIPDALAEYLGSATPRMSERAKLAGHVGSGGEPEYDGLYTVEYLKYLSEELRADDYSEMYDLLEMMLNDPELRENFTGRGEITDTKDIEILASCPHHVSKSGKTFSLWTDNGNFNCVRGCDCGGSIMDLAEFVMYGTVSKKDTEHWRTSCQWYVEHRGVLGPTEFEATQKKSVTDMLAADPLPELDRDVGDESWGHLLARTAKGKPLADENNIIVYLQRHKAFKGVLGYNTRSTGCCLLKPSPFDPDETQYPREINSSDLLRVVQWFSRIGISTTSKKIADLLRGLCMDPYHAHQFDPFKDYLDIINWDGVERIDNFLVRAAGAQNSAYIRDVSAKMLISAVARTYRPGCKVDTMPILVGPQGIGKSTMIRALLPDSIFFSDHMPSLADKDAKAQIHGLVFLEIGELDAFNRSDTTAIKNFVTVQVDRFRPPYGRAPENFPRTCIFIGTTNADDFLKDVTGARRFWPVDIDGMIDLDYIREVRDQLWAEAVVRYNIGESWWLSGEADTEQQSVAESHRESTPYESIISSYLELPDLESRDEEVGVGAPAGISSDARYPRFIDGKRAHITAEEILNFAVKVPIDRQTIGARMNVGKAMKALGWKKIKFRNGNYSFGYTYRSPQ